ncbi:hypothetical protein [Marinilabilia sp.]|uniref:hypothetical protein n=1 Tax=Marinilabilia sp. TaxID=2021252 RepID=UPI0025BE5388|nr:hypothetical protein [Marinilabilia sp.]
MKKLIVLVAIATLTACATKDISDLEEGMASKEVIDIAGEPTEKVEMPLDIEWWIYEEDKVLLILENDTVSNVTSQEEIEESLKDFEKGMDQIQKEIEELTK